VPVTPLHVGPALVVKAVAGRHFSVSVFALSQILIDIEPAVRFLRDDPILHGVTHTYLGATGIAIISVLAGRPLCQFLLDRWKDDPKSPFMNWLRGPAKISWSAAVTGAFLGAYSHIILDSIMHSDMEPFWPVYKGNALLHLFPIDTLHLVCVASGAAGAALMAALFGHFKSAGRLGG
jgi:hypothetical protein